MKSMITYNSSSPFIRLILTPSITHLQNALQTDLFLDGYQSFDSPLF